MSETQQKTLYQYDQDIGDAEAPPPLPLGTYRGQIKSVSTAPGKKDPTSDMAAVGFHVGPEQYPADFSEGDPDGTILMFYVSMANTARARYNLRQFIEAIGGPKGREIDLTSWLGLEAMIRVDHELYEGELRARIGRKGISPA